MFGKIKSIFNKKKPSKNKIYATGSNFKILRNGTVINSQKDPNKIVIGDNVHILGELFLMRHGGYIQIGEWTYIGDDTRIWSANKIIIGKRVEISYGVNIHDTISHSLSAKERFTHMVDILTTGHPSTLNNVPSKPVIIEDDVWIGFNSIILKGVTIGKGSIIGAGSVITHDVPEYSIVVGNPQRIVGNSKE